MSKTITADKPGATRCILHIITKFELADAHPVIAPFDANMKLSEVRNDNEEVEEDFPHQQPLGSLMFAMIGSRPDISYDDDQVFIESQVHCTVVKLFLNTSMEHQAIISVIHVAHMQHSHCLWGCRLCWRLDDR